MVTRPITAARGPIDSPVAVAEAVTAPLIPSMLNNPITPKTPAVIRRISFLEPTLPLSLFFFLFTVKKKETYYIKLTIITLQILSHNLSMRISIVTEKECHVSS